MGRTPPAGSARAPAGPDRGRPGRGRAPVASLTPLAPFLWAAALILLLGFAYAPLFGAGSRGEDRRSILSARGEWIAESLVPGAGWGPEADRRPLERTRLEEASLALSDRLAGRGPVERTLALVRAENLVLLGCAALAGALFARRLFLPWTGSEHARAAGWAAAVLLLLHPHSVLVVSQAPARGELLALALSAVGAVLFLRGRQDRRFTATAWSVFLCILAGFASLEALGLPLVLALAEALSARRYRPLRVRARTAMTTLLVFGAAASLELVLRLVRDGADAALMDSGRLLSLGSPADAARDLTGVLTTLGALLVPVHPGSFSGVFVLWTVALFALVLLPGVLAARGAPKLFGTLFGCWVTTLFVLTFLATHARIRPGELQGARHLLFAVALSCSGVGLLATAASGLPRLLMPVLWAAGLSVLARGDAVLVRRAADEASGLRADLVAARELFGPEPTVIVLDPPRGRFGIEPVGDAVAWLADPDRVPPEPQVPGILATSLTGFAALVREPEFESLRSRSPVVLLPPSAARAGRVALQLGAPSPSTGVRSWRGAARSPVLDVDPLELMSLELRASAGTATASPPGVSWSARPVGSASPPGAPRSAGSPLSTGGGSEGPLEGAWLSRGDEPRAVFDLGSSLAWLLGGRVRLLFFEGSILGVSDARLSPGPPPLQAASGGPEGGLVPRTQGADWIFEGPFDLPERWGIEPQDAAGGRFVVGLLELGRLRHRELPVWREGPERLRAPEAAALVERWVRGGAPVAWSLEYRIGSTCVRRSSGRRIGRPERPAKRTDPDADPSAPVREKR